MGAVERVCQVRGTGCDVVLLGHDRRLHGVDEVDLLLGATADNLESAAAGLLAAAGGGSRGSGAGAARAVFCSPFKQELLRAQQRSAARKSGGSRPASMTGAAG